MKKKWTLEMQKWILKVYFPKKGGDSSAKTMVHIHRLFKKFGFDKVFGRSSVMELLELKGSGASKFLSNLLDTDRYQGIEKENINLRDKNVSL